MLAANESSRLRWADLLMAIAIGIAELVLVRSKRAVRKTEVDLGPGGARELRGHTWLREPGAHLEIRRQGAVEGLVMTDRYRRLDLVWERDGAVEIFTMGGDQLVAVWPVPEPSAEVAADLMKERIRLGDYQKRVVAAPAAVEEDQRYFVRRTSGAKAGEVAWSERPVCAAEAQQLAYQWRLRYRGEVVVLLANDEVREQAAHYWALVREQREAQERQPREGVVVFG